MSKKRNNSAADGLGAILFGYLGASQQQRTERHRISAQRDYMVAREREITRRTMYQTFENIHREVEITEREGSRNRSLVEVVKERTKAIESWAGTVKAVLEHNSENLQHRRDEFLGLCKSLSTPGLGDKERHAILQLMQEHLKHQRQLSHDNNRTIKGLKRQLSPEGDDE